jgi:uncharacterized protein (TIGR03086 family)
VDLDDLTRAQEAVSTVVTGLAADDWDRRTPCEDWDVAAVVRHLAVGERAFAVSLTGAAYDLASLTEELAAIAPAALAAAYEEGSLRLRDALRRADPAGAFPTGIGPLPAPAIAELRTIEALTHAWDVARAVGAPLDVAEPVAERAITDSLALLDRLPPGRTPFGPPRPVADDAPAIDRLVALLGRDVTR